MVVSAAMLLSDWMLMAMNSSCSLVLQVEENNQDDSSQVQLCPHDRSSHRMLNETEQLDRVIVCASTWPWFKIGASQRYPDGIAHSLAYNIPSKHCMSCRCLLDQHGR